MLLKKARSALVFITLNLISIIRPLFGNSGCCIFEESCTKYTERILNSLPIAQAMPKMFKRIISCQPFNKRKT